jgi:hypothetical protein
VCSKEEIVEAFNSYVDRLNKRTGLDWSGYCHQVLVDKTPQADTPCYVNSWRAKVWIKGFRFSMYWSGTRWKRSS